MSDDETLAVYAAKSEDYANLVGGSDGPDAALQGFLDALPAGADVLDLGCGPGHSAGFMAAAGHQVTAMDAVAEFVTLAARYPGVTARLGTFTDLTAKDAYDGIWANFSLLHAPKASMPGHLAAIRRALRSGGVFHIGLKTGTGERRDALGRHYAYYEESELEGLLEDIGLRITWRERGEDKGLDGTMAPWITVRAHG